MLAKARALKQQESTAVAPEVPVVDSVNTDLVDELLAVPAEVKPTEEPVEAPVAPAPEAAPKAKVDEDSLAKHASASSAEKKTAKVFEGDFDVVTPDSILDIRNALRVAKGASGVTTFKVIALQSGFSTEIAPLSFADTTYLTASVMDNYTLRKRVFKTLFDKMSNTSVQGMDFASFLANTASGDLDTLMYGLYGSTYPGNNEFELNCRKCGGSNKLAVNVNELPQALDPDSAHHEIMKHIDPARKYLLATDIAAINKTYKRQLPESKIVVEIRMPTLQDQLDGAQWYSQAVDRETGMLPEANAGMEMLRVFNLHTKAIFLPVPGTDNKYYPVTDEHERLNAIRNLSNVDGRALSAAIDEITEKLAVNYRLPDYRCSHCQAVNGDLYIDFEAMLFTKLRAKA